MNMQMGNFHHKSKSGDQLLRMQLQKVSDECSKYKLDYESQAIKSIQLGQKVTNLSLDLNKTKLKLQYA